MVKDYGMRKSIPLNTTTKGLVSFGALDPGEAVNLETKTNRVGELLINKVTAFFDERAKEYINKTNEDKVFNVQWKDGTQIDYTVKPGQMLIWFKNENDQWLLDVHKAPDYLLNEKYINPFLKEGQISSYRSENGRIIYAGIPANPDVDILYLGAEIDRLADGPLMERKVKNSSSKRVSFVMMKDTDHINLMFGNKSLNILQDTMLSYFKTGLSEETVKLIDNNPHLDLNTNDERYKHTHDKVPRIQVDIESNAPTDICNKDNSLIFLHGILSKLIE
jgi:hypothetical protein